MIGMAVTSSKPAPFAALVRETRLSRGMNQPELAVAAGCDQQTIDKIERGITIFSGYLPAVFTALGLPLSLLAAQSPRIRSGKKPVRQRAAARKMYLAEWRVDMKADLKKLAKIVGVTTDEYLYHEQHPYKLSIEQLNQLAAEIGITPDQVWFPPPKRK
jgi:DNA-binding XRE family transcriptional regulator